MHRFQKVFGNAKCATIGMIHVQALPGTPKYSGHFNKIVEQAKHEANIYSKYKLNAVLLENMHDVPYVQNDQIGPETVACMTRLAYEVKDVLDGTSTACGVQILACGNCQALAVAKAAGLDFIRAEGFVFGHVADEGYTDACAGEILRYRRNINAENVLVFTDIKKKHSSHSITSDVSLLETAKAAEFFLSDGVILTGTSTGHAASLDDLDEVHGKTILPIIIGSGVTTSNIDQYFKRVSGVIVGSHFKKGGHWENELCESTICQFVEKLNDLKA